MTTRRRLAVLLLCSAGGLAVAGLFGDSYTGRLSQHTGFYQVHVDDRAELSAGLRRPRRATLVVVDGLSYLDAGPMTAMARLAAAGQCRKTDVGSLSLSRPVYAVISTGLEADRTGARFNDDPAPLTAEPVWDLARAAGFSVAGISELPWWRELFPDGFDTYTVGLREDDFFTRAPLADLQLIHPLYVDETAHETGSRSPEYRAAVARLDRELGRFLDNVDLARDLVVVTADHGHSLRGGHGGRQDRVAHVLTCYAGLGVRHDPTRGLELKTTTIGPSLAVLLGLPFPAEMRAGDDDLAAIWDIVDPSVLPPTWLADRHQAVDRFRAANADQLENWLPASDGSWDRFYAHHRGQQIGAAIPFAGAIGLVTIFQAFVHRRRGRRSALFGAAFVAVFCLAAVGVQVGLRGSFDLSSVAYREDFLGFTIVHAVLATAVAIAVHLRLRRDLPALLVDLSVLSLIGTLLCLAHPAVFGWQLGFPVPPPSAFFFPYWAALFLGVFDGACVLLVLLVTLRAARRTNQ